MRLNHVLLGMIVGGLIGVSVSGQTEEESFPVPAGPIGSDNEDAYESGPAPVEDVDRSDSSTADNVAQEVDELRSQYRQLIDRKAVLMNRSALREAISQAEQEIDELKAQVLLDEARQQLLELVKSHPETKAAQAARAMLQTSPERQPKAPTYSQPYGAPTPSEYGSNAPYYQSRANEPFTAEPSRESPFQTPNEPVRKKRN